MRQLCSGRCWIGLTDRVTESTFVWVDGSVGSFIGWAGGEPNGGTGENCGEMFVSLGGWNDAPCSAKHTFICETSFVDFLFV